MLAPVDPKGSRQSPAARASTSPGIAAGSGITPWLWSRRSPWERDRRWSSMPEPRALRRAPWRSGSGLPPSWWSTRPPW